MTSPENTRYIQLDLGEALVVMAKKSEASEARKKDIFEDLTSLVRKSANAVRDAISHAVSHSAYNTDTELMAFLDYAPDMERITKKLHTAGIDLDEVRVVIADTILSDPQRSVRSSLVLSDMTNYYLDNLGYAPQEEEVA